MSKLSAVRPPQDEEPAPPRRVRIAATEPDEEFDLAKLFQVVLERRWLIAATTLGAVLLGALYAILATPIYRADALVQVEQKKSGMQGLEDLTAMFASEAPAESEMELIRSRLVVGQVVDSLRLDIIAEPRYLPIVGRAVARRHADPDQLAEARLFLPRYAWGGERIRVERMAVPAALERERLTLVAGEGGRYTLRAPDGETLLAGVVGQAAAAGGAPGARTRVELFVSELRARPGTQFVLAKLSRPEAIKRLREQLQVGERAKKTGVVQLALDGPDPELITAALDEVTRVYLRQNVERKSAEAEKTLEFINAQLPELKKNLEVAEAALNAHRKRSGSVDLGLEAKAVIERSAEAERKATELEFQYAELRERFTEEHPTLMALRKQMRQLRSERGEVENVIKRLPESELAAVRLTRDVKVANELYLLLLNKAQELNVVKSGTLGNVRIVDPAAVQVEPVGMKTSLVLLISLLAGLGLGVALALALNALNRGVEDPGLLEQELGVSVYASVPHSDQQARMTRQALRNKRETLEPLALADPSELAIESLRSLRTSLQFALAESGSNVIAIGGPRPGIGKSFVSVNLAHVLAQSDQRVVLVDGDLRKGYLHRYFGLGRVAGLAELIRGGAELDEVLRPTGLPNLTFMTTGALPSNPSELLASARFRQVVSTLSERFDLVILDAPPVLAVTDGALIGREAGINLLVLKAGLHPMREVAIAVERLEQAGVRPNGFVVNDVVPRTGIAAGAQYGYHYEYK